jgi:hypothetical protein
MGPREAQDVIARLLELTEEEARVLERADAGRLREIVAARAPLFARLTATGELPAAARLDVERLRTQMARNEAVAERRVGALRQSLGTLDRGRTALNGYAPVTGERGERHPVYLDRAG